MVELQVGQTVMVIDGMGRANTPAIRGEVAKIGRVWVTVHKEGQRFGWRLRRDDQTDGSGFSHRARFYTLDQWAERLREVSAGEYLRDQGITLTLGSSWRGREIELAKLVGWAPPL